MYTYVSNDDDSDAGTARKKNRVLLISQSQLLQHSVSFVWQHHFRIDAFSIFRTYQTLPEFYLSLTIKYNKFSITTNFFSHVCQDCAVQTNSGRLAVSENSVLDRRRKGRRTQLEKIYIILRDRGAPFVPRGPG